MTQPVPTNPMQASSKPELRRMLRQRLATLDPAVRHAQSVLAADRVVATPEWQRAQTVMLFLPLPDEIETAPLAYRAGYPGKGAEVGEGPATVGGIRVNGVRVPTAATS